MMRRFVGGLLAGMMLCGVAGQGNATAYRMKLPPGGICLNHVGNEDQYVGKIGGGQYVYVAWRESIYDPNAGDGHRIEFGEPTMLLSSVNGLITIPPVTVYGKGISVFQAPVGGDYTLRISDDAMIFRVNVCFLNRFVDVNEIPWVDD